MMCKVGIVQVTQCDLVQHLMLEVCQQQLFSTKNSFFFLFVNFCVSIVDA